MSKPETEATKDGRPSGLAVAPCSALGKTPITDMNEMVRLTTGFVGHKVFQVEEKVVPSEIVRRLERENAILRARALAAVDAVGHWMPAMDTSDSTTAHAIRALRDVCGWKRISPNTKDQPRDP